MIRKIFASIFLITNFTSVFAFDIWNLKGNQISVPETDFSRNLKSWKSSNVEKEKLAATEKNSVLTIDCKGQSPDKSAWYFYMDYNKTEFKVPADNFVRISFEARKIRGEGNFYLCLGGKKDGKNVKSEVSKSKIVDSKTFQEYRILYRTSSNFDSYYLRFLGQNLGKYEVKNIKIDYVSPKQIPAAVTKNQSVYKNGKFEGILTSRGKENLGRGLNCIKTEKGQFISWRFLDSDSKKTCFTVSKLTGKKEILLTKSPIRDSTNFLDSNGKETDVYILKAFSDSSLKKEIGKWQIKGNRVDYKEIRLQSKDLIARGGVAIGDLNGDGEYDFVVKTSAEYNIDPAESSGWHPSVKPLTLEAYTNEGKFLWKKNLGWNIESGIWYSPYVVADLDGDGKCEVIAKTSLYTDKGEKDFRDKDGRVHSGPQYLSVFDGMTGEEITKIDWVDWAAYENEGYSHSVRNQIAIAYLDGRTPCVIMLSGTYGHQDVRTFFMKDKKLVPIWSYNNQFLGKEYQGQGAHWTVCADIDEDGRDEVVIGSVCFDDNGDILWTTGRGHPDAVYYGEINPDHKGKELLYFYETKQKDGGFLMLDAKTGKKIWRFNEPTDHIHSQALCSDIDPKIPGREFYGMNSGKNHQKTEKKWYFSGNCKLLKSGDEIDSKWGWSPDVAYITEKPFSTLFRLEKEKLNFRPQGTVITVCDFEGDWREEIITNNKNDGILRIYSTPFLSKNRRAALMQDNFYHSVVTNNSSGYGQHPEVE